jgi:hypothetical protein
VSNYHTKRHEDHELTDHTGGWLTSGTPGHAQLHREITVADGMIHRNLGNRDEQIDKYNRLQASHAMLTHGDASHHLWDLRPIDRTGAPK